VTITRSDRSFGLQHTDEAATATVWKRTVTVGIGAAIVCQLALLMVVGFANANALNPDAVAYLLLASHYAEGEFGLAVTGYWSPLLTWILAPLVGGISDPLIAARIAMGVSAVVFLVGSISLFDRLRLPPVARVLATWIVAVASVSWSVANITPDLLMGGLLCLALARILPPTWLESRRTQFGAGLLCGAAYLAKAAALPALVLVVTATALLRMVTAQATPRSAARAVGVTLVGMTVLAGPWIATLSIKYGSLVVSTSARAAHAIVGPPDIPRDKVDVFEKPEPGRNFADEDLTYANYNHWSPFESWSYFKHQVQLGYRNAARFVDIAGGFDRLHIGLVASLLGLLIHSPFRRNLSTEPWRLAALPILATLGVYAPVYAGDERFYYGLFPFVVAASFGLVRWLTPERKGVNAPRWLGMAMVVVSFLIVHVPQVAGAAAGHDATVSETSRAVARSLRATAFNGAIAAAGDCFGATDQYASYVALFIDRPYYNCEAMPSAERMRETGATLLVVHRDLTSLVEVLDNDPGVEDFGSTALPSGNGDARLPIRLYRVREP
jgi:hypothetical protein